MVFAANGATVVDGNVLGAQFRDPERAAEAPAYLDWFERAGLRRARRRSTSTRARATSCSPATCLLAGTGFRTDHAAHAEAQELFGRPVITLQLVDPRFYHLDTALSVLDETTDRLPARGVLARAARPVLRRLFPDAVIATAADAEVLGLNAVSDGRHVVLPARPPTWPPRCASAATTPIPVDLSELRKAGGGPKCCTLEVRS